MGSSPRMRGKRRYRQIPEHSEGLIPAYAGKTYPRIELDFKAPAHPRVCGENSPWSPGVLGPRGSSPRMRGKLGPSACDEGLGGLIPAYAGKTLACHAHLRDPGAHPRVCGENDSSRGSHFCMLGSSPRMRGKPSLAFAVCSGAGLIPAYAGKTSSAKAKSTADTAHPRVCGENISDKGQALTDWGSSPRMRGKLTEISNELATLGLIPAYAGKTL